MAAVDTCDEHVFAGARDYLVKFHLERELVIRMCRDLTSTSKKLIFALHRSASLDDSTTVYAHVQALSVLLAHVGDICSCSIHLDEYRPTISNAAEELCEAFLFLYFLHTNRLASCSHLLALFNALQTAGLQESPDITEILTDFVGDRYTEHAASVMAYISEGDYFMGIFDLTGEIMRFAIGNLLDARSHALSDESVKALDFLQQVHKNMVLFLDRNPQLSVERGIMSNRNSNRGRTNLAKKMEVFHQSLEKVRLQVREKLIQSLEVI